MTWRIAICALLLNVVSTAFAQTGTSNYTAMWWNAAEPGWGLNIAHQGDVLFPMWFTYGANGRIQWYAVSGAARQADGSYAGEVFRFTGKPFNLIAGSTAFNTTDKAGTASLRFIGDNALQFAYTVDSITQSKSLVRFVFGAEPVCTFSGSSRAGATNYTDIWWNANESGWGLTLAHQGDSMFGLWYTYDGSGAAQWISALGSKQLDGSFRGDLNRAVAGTAFNQINGVTATSFPLPKVGEFELRFSNGEAGTFKTTLDGIEQTRSIGRFVFGSPVSVCNAVVTQPGGGTADGCVRIPKVGDVRRFRRSSGSGGIVLGGDTLTERVVGTTVLDDEVVLVRETFNGAGRRIQRQLERVTAHTLDILLVDRYDSGNGALISTTRFSPAQRSPLNPAVGSLTQFSYNSTREEFLPLRETLNFDEVEQFRRLPDEAVAAPIGSVPASCKFDRYRRSQLIPAAPAPPTAAPVFETRGTVWTLHSPGEIRVDQTQTQAGGSTANVRSIDEAVSFQGGP